MADTWLTIEQAAVALGLSVRTVNRHIVAGKLPSRLQDGRREVLVQTPADKAADVRAAVSAVSQTLDDSPFGAVLSPFASDSPSVNPSVTGPAIAGHATVTIPPPADRSSDRFNDRPSMSDRMSDSPSDRPSATGIDTETVLALADNANEKAELAVSAYQALARATDAQFQHVRRSARFAWAAVAVMAVGVSAAVGWTTYHLTRAQVQTEYLREQVLSKTAATDTLSAEREGLRAELTAAKEQAAKAEGKASVLTEVQTRLETDVRQAQARASDAETREAKARAALSAATPPATTRPVSQPSDARADGHGG